MKNIKVNVPEGYEIDEERSNINLEKGIIDINFKEKVKRWRDDCNAKISGFWIDSHSDIDEIILHYNIPENYNTFATEKQAKSALAMARISQIMANDKRFGGVVTDEEWKNNNLKYVIFRVCNDIITNEHYKAYEFLAFHTKEQMNLFLNENKDLVKQYLMID